MTPLSLGIEFPRPRLAVNVLALPARVIQDYVASVNYEAIRRACPLLRLLSEDTHLKNRRSEASFLSPLTTVVRFAARGEFVDRIKRMPEIITPWALPRSHSYDPLWTKVGKPSKPTSFWMLALYRRSAE